MKGIRSRLKLTKPFSPKEKKVIGFCVGIFVQLLAVSQNFGYVLAVFGVGILALSINRTTRKAMIKNTDHSFSSFFFLATIGVEGLFILRDVVLVGPSTTQEIFAPIERWAVFIWGIFLLFGLFAYLSQKKKEKAELRTPPEIDLSVDG